MPHGKPEQIPSLLMSVVWNAHGRKGKADSQVANLDESVLDG